MSAVTVELLTEFGPLVPTMGTIGVKGAVKILKGTIVVRDSSGRGLAPTDGDGNPMAGVAVATYDNTAGADSAIDAELRYGVCGFAISGTTPKLGDRLYVVDNATVSISDNGGTRGFAGICSESRNSLAYFACGPSPVPSEGGGGSAVNVAILDAFEATTGNPLAAFANGASAVPGIALVNAKVTAVRWNNNATMDPIVQTVYLPAPSDPAAKATIHFYASKIGATLADATTFTVLAYAAAVGGLHDADTNEGGTSTAMAGAAASKTVQEVTLDLLGSTLPDTACFLTLSIQPTNGTLGTDDLCLHAVRITR